MLTTIRTFRHGGLHGEHRYRHGMSFHTDDVLLQRLNPATETPEDEWVSLLRYDPHCNVWDMAGKCVGTFRTVGGHWLFQPIIIITDQWAVINCESTRSAESLLDSEVIISKHWLDVQATKVIGGTSG